jgi:hypothetical protein
MALARTFRNSPGGPFWAGDRSDATFPAVPMAVMGAGMAI